MNILKLSIFYQFLTKNKIKNLICILANTQEFNNYMYNTFREVKYIEYEYSETKKSFVLKKNKLKPFYKINNDQEYNFEIIGKINKRDKYLSLIINIFTYNYILTYYSLMFSVFLMLITGIFAMNKYLLLMSVVGYFLFDFIYNLVIIQNYPPVNDFFIKILKNQYKFCTPATARILSCGNSKK